MRKLGGSGVPLREIARLWVNYHPGTMMRLWLSATREAERLMQHARFLTVRYEDLVQDPQTAVAELCGKLGIEFDDAMLAVPHYGSSTVKHSASTGLSTAALEKWKRVLNGFEIRYCERKTRSERPRWSYPDCDDSGSTILGAVTFVLRWPIHVIGVVLANPKRMMILLKALLAGRRNKTAA
jgi:hypothetical protein